MFGMPPEQPSKEELQVAEQEAFGEVKFFAAVCLALYSAPHFIEYVTKLI